MGSLRPLLRSGEVLTRDHLSTAVIDPNSPLAGTILPTNAPATPVRAEMGSLRPLLRSGEVLTRDHLSTAVT